MLVISRALRIRFHDLVEALDGSSDVPRGQSKTKSAEAEIRRTANTRYGLFRRSEALAAGLSPRQIGLRLREGTFTTVYPCVYALAGAPNTFEQQMLGACLWQGNDWAASHRSAGILWGLDAVPSGHIELISTRQPSSRGFGVVIHRSKGLKPFDVVTRAGIPLTWVPRTLLDLASVLDDDDVEAALESALRKGLVSISYLERYLGRFSAPGRNGCGALRRILHRRSADDPPTGSLFETRLYQCLRRAGLPLPERQVVVERDGRFVGRVDFCYPDANLVIEAESYEHHGSRDGWDGDIDRYNDVTLTGRAVLRITWARLRDRPRAVANDVATALGMPLPYP